MTISDLKNMVLSNTYTATEAHYRLSLVRDYLEQKLFSKEHQPPLSLDDALAKKKVSDDTLEALAAWGEDFYGSFSAETLYSRLEELKHEIDRVSVVRIYVPVMFTDTEAARLGKWFRKNVLHNSLLSFKIDPSTVGGCGIAWNNKYHDYSFKRFANRRRKELLGIIRSYGTAK